MKDGFNKFCKNFKNTSKKYIIFLVELHDKCNYGFTQTT